MDEYMEVIEELEEETPETAPGGEWQEAETPAPSESPEEDDTLPDENPAESGTVDLIERLDTLIDVLTPEDSPSGDETETVENDSAGNSPSGDALSENEPSLEDACNAELLESISSALASMEAENAAYQEEMLILKDELLTCEKTNITLLLALGFFTALSCGNRFADSFFNRMKVG